MQQSDKYGLDRTQWYVGEWLAQTEVTPATPAETARRKAEYESALLSYIYDHNPNAGMPFDGKDNACVIPPSSAAFLSQEVLS